MAATNGRTVTVFGGTGFLGRRIVRICALADFNGSRGRAGDEKAQAGTSFESHNNFSYL